MAETRKYPSVNKVIWVQVMPCRVYGAEPSHEPMHEQMSGTVSLKTHFEI